MAHIQPAKNQVKSAHMVSSGYISGWADQRNVIAVLDLEKGIGYHRSYKKATVVNYVYEPALLSHDLEGEYARIESAGIRVIRMLRMGRGLTVEEPNSADRVSRDASLSRAVRRSRGGEGSRSGGDDQRCC